MTPQNSNPPRKQESPILTRCISKGLPSDAAQTIDAKTHIESHFRFYNFFRGFPLAIPGLRGGLQE